MVDASASFGFTPSGSIGGLTGLTGKADVQIGLIGMDFGLYDCTGSQCTGVAASTATQVTAGVNMSATLDFGTITTGPSLIFNTPLAAVFRSIMNNGISQFSGSPRLSELPWQASVKEFDASIGTLVMDAGLNSRISPNQTFEVYVPVDTTSAGNCIPYQVVAYIHTITVDTVSSQAIVDQSFGTRGVQAGDVVMIRAVGSNSGPK
jgi:hypothetical protein